MLIVQNIEFTFELNLPLKSNLIDLCQNNTNYEATELSLVVNNLITVFLSLNYTFMFYELIL